MKTLGKFEILDKIGQGAMGVVYKARDPLIGRLVALKTISAGLAEDTESLERFYQEARAAGTLQHPNIVTIFELGKQDDTPFIAMEFLEGASLDKVISARLPMPLSQKLGYIVHVCRAIEYAHKRGVVHRDIKPGNVMLTDEGTVKVVDFGIARLAESSRSQSGMLIGTLAYMSPQQIKGEHAAATSDIWAAGAMFYELIAYRPPFEGHNYGALMMNILTQDLPPLAEADPTIPLDVAAVVDRMLRKDVKERFQSMEEVLIELEPCWKRLQQAEVSGLVADAQQLLKKRDLERALQAVRRALKIDAENTAARDLLEKINAELRHSGTQASAAALEARSSVLQQAGESNAGDSQETLPPDANVTQLLRQAGEAKQAEKAKRDQQETVQTLRALIATGKLDDAAVVLRQAVESRRLAQSDPEIGELQRQIEARSPASRPIPDVQARSAAAAASAGVFAPGAAESFRPGMASAPPKTSRPAQRTAQTDPVAADPAVPVDLGEAVGKTKSEPRTGLLRRPVVVVLAAVLAIGAVGAGVYLLKARPRVSSAPPAGVLAASSPVAQTAVTAGAAAPADASSIDLSKQQELLISRAMEAANGSKDYTQAVALLQTARDLNGPRQAEVEKYLGDYQRLNRFASVSGGGSAPPSSVPPTSAPRAIGAQNGATQTSAPVGGLQPDIVPNPPSPSPAAASAPSAQPAVAAAVPPVSSPAGATPPAAANVRAEEPVAPVRAPVDAAPVTPVAGAGANNPDRQAITSAIDQLSAAFSHRSMAELQEVWPKVGGAVRNNLKSVFDSAQSLSRDFHVQSLQVANDGATATVIGTYDGKIRVRGAESASNGNFYVRLAKRNGKWYVDDASF
jgi:hypothetical protein